MSRARLVAIAVVIAIAASLGCSRVRADVERVCEAPLDPAPGTRAARLDRGLDRLAPTLKTEEGRRLVRRMRAVDADPGALLAAEAARRGIRDCPIADAYREESARARWREDVVRLCAFRLDELGDALQSDEGRALARSLATMDAASRRARLAAAAKDVGLPGCAQARP